MRPRARAALLALAAAACGDNPTAPDPDRPASAADVAGTYALASYRGRAVPWADTSTADPRSGAVVYGGSLTLRPDSVVITVLRVRDSTAAQPHTEVDSSGWWLPPAPGSDAPEGVTILYVHPGHDENLGGAHYTTPTLVYYQSFRFEARGRRLREVYGPDGSNGSAVYTR